MLQSGDVVDRYRLEEPLGAGAFGEVWKASQLASGEPIGITHALKIMRLAHDRAGSSPRTLPSGWLDEAQHLVRVAGSTVPRIHEANVWNEHAYIAMELLEGTTLRARLAHGPIAWRRALFIADQIATALEAAHKIELIHRDLKPQNVMLVGPQRCCVLDWGIARLRMPSAQPVDSGLARQSTSDIETTDAAPVTAKSAQHLQHTPVGTPGYMAPEVYDGAHPSPAQDAYSLGVVLYEMIAGCLPHAVVPAQPGRVAPDAMKAYRVWLDKATMDHALVPLRDHCPGVPVAVAELVDGLLAPDPEQRPKKLREAIEQASRFPHGIPDPPYVGLSTLGLPHAGLYFGQQDTIQRVMDYLTSQRAALLWGPSGSGKSSLALAGVAATMDRTLFLGMDAWDIHVVRPRDGKGFRAAPDAAASPRPTIGQVVVLDQLEEVVDLEPAVRDVFCAAVLALLERSAPVVVRDATIGIDHEVKVIATIRDDLEWRVDREVPALRPLLEHRIIVKGIDVNLTRSIIEEPARALGYEVEDLAVVIREVQECLSAEPARLPEVQYALSEWWERRDDARKMLSLAAWYELGGVDGALSFVAERFFSALDHGQQQRLRTLFIQLFRGGRKQPLVESSLAPGDRFLMQELRSLRLVGRHDNNDSEPFYEVEHEYLSAHWVRLAGWLAEARDDQALAEDLERDATAYLLDRDLDRLWKRGRISTVMEMAQRGRIALSDNATLFLKHARRRALRGRLSGAGIALVLSTAWILSFNKCTDGERRELERKLQLANKAWQQARDAKQAADVEQVQARQYVQYVKSIEDALKVALSKAAAASLEASQYRAQAKDLEQRLNDTMKEAQNLARLLKEAQDSQTHMKALRPSAPSVRIRCNSEDIRSYTKRYIHEFLSCYKREFLASPALAGTVQVEFFIMPDGKVKPPITSRGDERVSQCVADVIKTIAFPKPEDGERNCSFDFTPAGAIGQGVLGTASKPE